MIVSQDLSSIFFRGVAVLGLGATLFACVVEERGPRWYGPDDAPTYTPPPDDGTTVPSAPASTSPMLVVVDTNQVMNATPGHGVGIFTEYAAGGKWHVWWTCDTALSGLTCDVELSATVASGAIDGALADAAPGTTLTTPDPTRVEARTITSTEVHGFTFHTTPGAVVTLDATVGGLREGPGANRSFFFFVQGGKINGGYTGALTNPLQLEGSAP